MNPPLNILRTIFRPYGARLYRAPKKDYVYPGYGYNYGAQGTGTQGYTLRYTADMRDSDFILFYGPKENNSAWSLCRACKKYCWGQSDRQKHMLEHNGKCPRGLYGAFRRLRMGCPPRCAVCNKPMPLHPTPMITYGVYLCSPICKLDWKHNDVAKNRIYLLEALRLEGWTDD